MSRFIHGYIQGQDLVRRALRPQLDAADALADAVDAAWLQGRKAWPDVIGALADYETARNQQENP